MGSEALDASRVENGECANVDVQERGLLREARRKAPRSSLLYRGRGGAVRAGDLDCYAAVGGAEQSPARCGRHSVLVMSRNPDTSDTALSLHAGVPVKRDTNPGECSNGGSNLVS